jgi:predicted Zn-dependent peptidase
MSSRNHLYCAALAVLLLCTSAFADYRRVNSPNPDDPMDVHIYELDNGLRVYLTRNTETPRFYAEIAVRAGSKQDPANATGLAHYLEHLLFKGTTELGTLDYDAEKPYLDRITALYEEHFRESDADKRKEIYAEINRVALDAAQYAIPNELDKLYNSMGASALNAHTWHEETVYKVGLPMNRIRHWAAIESHRFADPVFRLFHTELETVYEEKNRTLDNKSRVINEAVSELLFKQHPYGQQSTIGTVDHLKNPSLVIIDKYFKTWYVPNNMGIFISGNIDIAETIDLIDEHFSSWTEKPLPTVGPWEEKALQGAERVEVTYPGEEYVLLAYRTAPHHHPDEEALMLFDMILDNATAGLINLNLNQKQLVRQAGSYPMMMNDYGAQYFWGIPKEGQSLEEVERLLLDQVAIIQRGEFEDWLLEAIVNDFKKNRKASLESDGARVDAMRSAYLSFTDWDDAVSQIERLEKVTKADVVRVAKTYFGDNYVAGYRRDAPQDLPTIEKPRIDPIPIDASRQSQFAKRIQEIPYEPIEPTFVSEEDYAVHTFPNGIKLYYSPNPLNDLFAFTMAVEFGSFEDNTIGIATQLMDKAGTATLSPEDLKKEWYKLGSEFSLSAGDNESFVSVSGLDENFGASLSLMMDVLQRAAVDDATLEELKGIILQSREDAKKDPGTLSMALTRYNRLGEESNYLRMLPSEEVRALTVSDLLDVVRELPKYKHVLMYTGSLPMESVIDALEQHHPTFKNAELKDPPPYRFLRSRQPEANEIYFLHKDAAQAQVRFEFSNGFYDEDDTLPVSMYNAYFAGGMSGIVFQELREARALAYSAGALYHQGSRIDDENLMIGVIGCQADKTPEAVEAFLDLFDNLPESRERFAEAVDSMLNRIRTGKIGFRGVIGAVRGWERLGLEGDPRTEQFEELQDAELADLLAFHADRIRNRPKLISIVGDRNRIDLDALAQYGTVREVTVDEIFVD